MMSVTHFSFFAPEGVTQEDAHDLKMFPSPLHPLRTWRPAAPPPAGWSTRAACPFLPRRGWAAGERLALPATPRWAGRPGWSCSGSGPRKRSPRAALRSWRRPSLSAILCTTVCRPAAAKDDPSQGWGVWGWGGQRGPHAHPVHRQSDPALQWTRLLVCDWTVVLPWSMMSARTFWWCSSSAAVATGKMDR